MDEGLAVTAQLDLYLDLERAMLFAEGKQQDDAAEAVRDVMDRLWYSLDETERRLLDLRTVNEVASIDGIKLPQSPSLFIERPPTVRFSFPGEPIRDWRMAA